MRIVHNLSFFFRIAYEQNKLNIRTLFTSVSLCTYVLYNDYCNYTNNFQIFTFLCVFWFIQICFFE